MAHRLELHGHAPLEFSEDEWDRRLKIIAALDDLMDLRTSGAISRDQWHDTQIGYADKLETIYQSAARRAAGVPSRAAGGAPT